MSMLCKFAILLQEQILTISPPWWGLLSVALHIIIFIVNTLVDNGSRPMSAQESLKLL